MSGDLPSGGRPDKEPPRDSTPDGGPDSGEAESQRSACLRRACLRCGGDFESAWSGERICGRCKESVAWRQGLPYRSNHDRRS